MNKYNLIAVLIALIGMLVVVLISAAMLRSTPTHSMTLEAVSRDGMFAYNEGTVQIGDTTVRVEQATEPDEWVRGLSGQEHLKPGQGMLFVFNSPGMRGFHMPDMNFALDMIWLNDAMQVISVTENATPDSYPQLFYPASPATYVLEVPAFFARDHGIRPGIYATLTAP